MDKITPVEGSTQKPLQISAKAALSPEHKDALCLLGYSFIQHRQGEKARLLFTALTTLFPQDIPIKLSLGYACLMTEHYAQALETAGSCQPTSVSGADNTPVDLIKIQALWGLDRKDEARRLLQSYLRGDSRP